MQSRNKSASGHNILIFHVGNVEHKPAWKHINPRSYKSSASDEMSAHCKFYIAFFGTYRFVVAKERKKEKKQTKREKSRCRIHAGPIFAFYALPRNIYCVLPPFGMPMMGITVPWLLTFTRFGRKGTEPGENRHSMMKWN